MSSFPLGAESSPPLDRALARAVVRQALFGDVIDPYELGRFKLLERLGRGGMGIVYRAYDPRLERLVAVKILLDSRPEYAHRLDREAKALAKLSHPNVVHVYEIGVHEGTLFVAMEFVDGQTLRAWAQTRAWPEIWSALSDAGRGLAAAHRAGIVHRDFKPENVLIDKDGVVKVLDFGLARLGGQPSTISGVDRETLDEAGAWVGSPDTRTGAVMGTPRYMAPEQLEGRVDERSDQFAFCVSAFELLYGIRPFEGNTVAALGEAMQAGKLAARPRGSSVPKWLDDTLVRGLRPEPGQRFGSMNELLAVQQSVTTRRRRTLGIAAVGAFGCAGAVAWLPAREPCPSAAAELAGTWDDEVSSQVRRNFVATSEGLGASAADRVTQRLDAFADRWVTQSDDNCRATRVAGSQSERQMELRTACLFGARTDLRGVVAVLLQPNPEIVERAHRVVDTLPELRRCSDDLDAMRDGSEPPPELAEAVASSRQRLAEVVATIEAGRYKDAAELAEQTAAQVRTLGFEPLVTEAELARGKVYAMLSEHERAEQHFAAGYAAALRQGRWTLLHDAAVGMANLLATRLERPDEARGFADTAIALLERPSFAIPERYRTLLMQSGLARKRADYERAEQHLRAALELVQSLPGNETKQAEIRSRLAAVFQESGRPYEAVKEHEAAIAALSELLGPEHPEIALRRNDLANALYDADRLDEGVAQARQAIAALTAVYGDHHAHIGMIRSNLGGALAERKRFAEAETEMKLALEIRRQALGPDHPGVAATYNNLGALAAEQGRYAEAEAAHRHALDIRRRTLGEAHPGFADSVGNLAFALARQQRYGEAETLARQALAIREQVLPPEHPTIGRAKLALGGVVGHLGKFDEAERLFRQALEQQSATLGPDHLQIATTRADFGGLLMRMGRRAEARAELEAAISIYASKFGEGAPELGFPLTTLGAVLLDEGKPELALEVLQRAEAIRLATDAPADLLAETRFELARALWSRPAARVRARALAKDALQTLRARPGPGGGDLPRIEAWLRAHR